MKKSSVCKSLTLLAVVAIAWKCLTLLGVVGVAGYWMGRRHAPAGKPTAQRERAESGEGKDVILSADSQKLGGIKTEPVAWRSLSATLEATGEVVLDTNRVVKVSSFVAGRLTRLHANIGDGVRAGQTLAQVDSTEVAQARAARQQAQAEARVAEEKLRNTQRLAQAGVFTAKSVDEARKERNDVASQLAGMRVEYESELANAQAGVRTAQAVFDRAENSRKLAEQELRRRKALVAAGALQYKPLEDARRDMAEAEKSLRQARSASRLAGANLARSKKLFEVGVRSQRELEEAQAARDAAEADERKTDEQFSIAKQALAREQKIFDEKIYARRETQQAETDLAQTEQVKAESEAVLQQARQRLELARSSTKKKALDEMKNRLAALESLLRRESSVAQQRLYANKEVQAADADVAQARLRLLAADNALRVLRASPAGVTASVPVVAPIEGRVLERPVNRGQVIKPEDTLFTLLDLSRVWVDFRIYEKDIHAVSVGQPVEIISNAYPNERFLGKVHYIGDTVDEKTRTLTVRCVLANPQRRLKPQMFVRARITVSTQSRSLVVPDQAVQKEGNKSLVYVAVGKDKFEKREVRLGIASDGYHEVLQGLKPGEKVVTEGSFLVKSQEKKGEFGEDE